MNLLLLACNVALLPAADDGPPVRDKLVGRWVCTQFPGQPKEAKAAMRLTFSADDRVTIALELPGVSKTVTGKYKVVGDKLLVTDLSEPLGNRTAHEQGIQLKGDELILKDSDGTTAIFKKG